VVGGDDVAQERAQHPGLPVEVHLKPDGTPWRGRSHDQMQVASVEAVDDPPTGLVEHDGLSLDRRVTNQGPMVGGIGGGRGSWLRKLAM
jgi:hypothetical protein